MPKAPEGPKTCSICGGSGTIWVQVVDGPKGKERPVQQTCPACRGTGFK